MEIKIPCNDDGYVLLQCHLCGEYFKVRGSDINSDDFYQIWCPYCGLISDSYVTSEVIDVALKSATNTAMEEIYNVFKDFEKKTRNNKFINFKAGKKPKQIFIPPIQSKIDKLETCNYECCKKQAKIMPLSKYIGSYCPFCGGRYDEL